MITIKHIYTIQKSGTEHRIEFTAPTWKEAVEKEQAFFAERATAQVVERLIDSKT